MMKSLSYYTLKFWLEKGKAWKKAFTARWIVLIGIWGSEEMFEIRARTILFLSSLLMSSGISSSQM